MVGLKSKEIVYLQSQDGNIYRYPPRPGSEPQLRNLQAYVESEVSWMEEALGTSMSYLLITRYGLCMVLTKRE
jgi:hypothetical protein